MSSPLRPRRARTRERGAGLGPAVGQRRRQRPLLHGPGAAGVLRRPHTICLCESGEPDDEARGLDHPPQAEPRAEAVLLSSPPADAFRPPEPLSALALLGLDARGPYPSGMTGTGRAITQTRVSHHSERFVSLPGLEVKMEAQKGAQVLFLASLQHVILILDPCYLNISE